MQGAKCVGSKAGGVLSVLYFTLLRLVRLPRVCRQVEVAILRPLPPSALGIETFIPTITSYLDHGPQLLLHAAGLH